MAGTDSPDESLAEVVDSLPGIFYLLDRSGRLLRWNRNFEVVTGYSAEELPALHALDFFTGDDRALVAARIAETFAKGASDVTAHLVSKDGTATPYYFTGRRIDRDGAPCLVGMGIDLSARVAAEDALRHERNRLKGILDRFHMGVYLVNARHEVEYVNPVFVREFGEPKGRRCFDYLHGRADPCPWCKLPDVQAGRDVSWEFTVDRTGRTYELFDVPFENADGSVSKLEFVHDVTDRKRLEDQLRQAQKMEAIGQLAGGVAHDFNNILAAMIMQLEVIRMDGSVPAPLAPKLESLRSAADRAANLTRQLLLFSRRQVMQSRDLDLNQVVTRMVAMLHRLLGEDVRLEVRMHQAPLVVHGDAGMLDQVLLNLAVNARDAMPGGGDLVVETSVGEHVGLSPDGPPGRYACLRVSDTGHGIAPDDMPRIFEPFFTTKEAGRGTGLGLATVYGIVRQHHGWLDVQSEPGRGTTFQVWLPASATTEVARERHRPEPRGGSETILLAEDDQPLRRLMCMILERRGYRVLEAASGVDALRVYAEHDGHVGLLLTDLVMPEGLGGRELALRLRERNPDLRVVYTSGYSVETAGRELVLGRGERFIPKPSSPLELLATIRQCLDE